MGEHETRSVAANELPELFRWIHWQLADEDFACVLKHAMSESARLRTPVYEVVCRGNRVAAAYFTALPGRVATLGGIRALPGGQTQAAQLVLRSVSELCAQFSQIQAIVAEGDTPTESILQQARFRHLTQVQHLWLDVDTHALSQPKQPPSAAEGDTPTDSILQQARLRHLTQVKHPWLDVDTQALSQLKQPPSAAISWLPSHAVSRFRMQQLLETTFIETLDCPKLNGLRSNEDVLESFLNGTTYRRVNNWELLQVNGSLGGCLMLSSHSRNLNELAYMGLVPSLRGRGLGEFMLRRSISKSVLAGKHFLVVAVDEKNWPALALYRRHGFEPHRTFSVWLFLSHATA